MFNVFKKLFGSTNEGEIKKLRPIVDKINSLEGEMKALTDEGMREKTREYQMRVQGGESLDSILPEAFADRLSRSGLPNPDFVAFSREITLLRYARQGADRETVALGTRAYLRFRSLMKRSERLKFDLHRALKGLGDFNQIP